MSRHSHIHLFARAGLAALLAVSWVGCESAGAGSHGGRDGHGGKGPGGWGEEGKEEQAPIGVEVVSLAPATIERHYRTSGLLKALRSAEIVALQAGVIEDIKVEEGDQVAADAVLARLDGAELKLQAAANRLQVENLQAELDRLHQAAGAISREEIDKQRYAVAEARATAKLSGHAAQQSLVRAPFGGTITRRHIDEGNLAGTATPLFTLEDLGALQIELHLPEREAARVSPGSTVQLELIDGTQFAAEIIRRAPVVDATTGTVKFTVQTETAPPGAAPGAFARAFVLVESAVSAPSLPATAVFEVDGIPHVYVVADGVARRTAVETGVEGEDRVEIRGGLSGSDRVVVGGPGGISEGTALKAMPADGAPEAKSGA